MKKFAKDLAAATLVAVMIGAPAAYYFMFVMKP